MIKQEQNIRVSPPTSTNNNGRNFFFWKAKNQVESTTFVHLTSQLLALGRTLFPISMLLICYSDFCYSCYIIEIQCFIYLLLGDSHLWRAVYVVNGMGQPTIWPIFFSWLFTRCRALRYCRRTSPPASVRMGNK